MMTMASVQSRGKRETIEVFDFSDDDDDDERVGETSTKLLRVGFLRSERRGHKAIDVEVLTKEERSRRELSEYETGDIIDLISDGSNLSTSSLVLENNEAATGEEVTSSASDLHEDDNKSSQVLIIPNFIIYGDMYCTNSRLMFSHKFISVESSSMNGTEGTFSCQWKIEDIIRIESQWCLEVETAFFSVILKSMNPKESDSAKEISGIDLLKILVYGHKWSKEVETIKSLDSRYKDIWFDTITESEESASSGDNLRTSLTNLADSFEDLVYPQGDPEAVVVTKQDIELLKPRRFINDTIIDFYIKYLKSGIPPAERGRFHFFNCFFFRKLANLDKGSSSEFGGKEAYQRVQKWTKHVNLFEKDYIFVPINCSRKPVKDSLHLASGLNKRKSRSWSRKHFSEHEFYHFLMPIMYAGHSYLGEEWKARHGSTTIDFSNALQLVSLELPQQNNSFDCGLFLLHYLDLFVAQAPPKFNPSLITRSANFLTKNWFPAKEASRKRRYILELLYNLHKGHHDPSISPANSKIRPPHCGVSNNDDEEEKDDDEGENVVELCDRRKPFDDSSLTVAYTPRTKTWSLDMILSKAMFYTRGYDSKRRKVFMPTIVEEVQKNCGEEALLPIDIQEESISQDAGETSRKDECMICIEEEVEYVSDSQDSYEAGEAKEDDELLQVTERYRRRFDGSKKESKCDFMIFPKNRVNKNRYSNSASLLFR